MSRRFAALPLFPVEPPQGFDAARLPTVRANGSPFITNAENPPTVPVPLPVILADVIGKYTERDRKLWRFLLHAAWEELETKRLHVISVREIARVFQEHGGDKNAAWIMESAKRLAATRVEFKITCGDPRFNVSPEDEGEGFSVLLAAARRSATTGSLIYEIPAMLVEIIKKPLRFARLRTHFIIGLSGKHSVTIYEILEAFANKDDPSFVVSVDEFRQWLNLKPTQYTDWKDLKRWVIRPALDQINANPDAAGFSVEMQPIKRGRDIVSLRFALTKTDGRSMQDTTLQRVAEELRHVGDNRPAGTELRASTLIDLHKKYPDIDIREAEREWLAWCAKKGTRPKSPDAAFRGFCATWVARKRH